MAEAHRPGFLARIATDDPELAAEVRSLLDAEAEGPLGPATDREPQDLIAEFVGPYRLLRRLGEGGMGIVFLAEREQAGFRQRVAVKLLRAGFLDPRLGEYVEHERRVLARLEHPNIARLIDGGSTPSGQPFLAMEYVEGDTLLDYASRHGLGVAERVRLVIAVCDAVHYAHQQLVVHRDLKPSNIMVGVDGRPRLLDFGISKLLDPEERAPGRTRSSPWLTPAYASPEQVRGDTVTTLSDVYALGLILYELLSGARPYRLEGQTPARVEQLVCEVPPPAPSVACSDPKVARSLRGDLDVIVLKALAKEPSRRYPSAEQLGEDLRRYLTGLPVAARPDSWGYRTSKLVRRHRTAAAVATLALVLLISGAVAVAWQARVARAERIRAEAALAQSEEVTKYLVGLFETADPQQATTDPSVAKRILEQGVARADELSGQPLVQASMLDALGMIYVNLDEHVRAAELITRGLETRRAILGTDHPDVATSLSHLGRALRGQSRYPEAVEQYQVALAIRLRVLGPDHPDLAVSYRDLGFMMPYLGQNEKAVQYYRQALELTRAGLGEDHPMTAQDMVTLGLALRREGQYGDGLAMMQEALARKIRGLGADDPETAITKFHVADALSTDGRVEEAERLYREGIDSRRRALGSNDLGMIHGMENLAAMLGRLERGSEAETLLREAARIRRERFGESSTRYASSLDLLAAELARQGRYDEAIEMKQESLRLWQAGFGSEHAAVAGSLENFSWILQAAGRLAEAETAVRRAIALRERLYGPNQVLTALSRIQLTSVLTSRRRFADAEPQGLGATAILEKLQPEGHVDRRKAYRVLAELYRAMQRPEEAARYRELAEAGTSSPTRAP